MGNLPLVGHYLHTRASRLAALIALAAVLQVAAAVGMAYVAGFGEVRTVLGRWSAPWLAAMVGAIVLSFLGYYVAYLGIYRVEDGPKLTGRQMTAVVAGGFGGFLAHGGSALDDYALRAAGADERDATVRVSVLAGMEHGVLAVIGTAAGIAVLAEGLKAPPPDFSLPWAVTPVPGFALAFWLAERYRHRLKDRSGMAGKLGIFLDSIQLNRLLFLHPHKHGRAVLGMTLFWLTDAFAMWAALQAFGESMNVARMPFAFASIPTLREMGEQGTPGAQQPADSFEAALGPPAADET